MHEIIKCRGVHVGHRSAFRRHRGYIEQNHVTTLGGALQRDNFFADVGGDVSHNGLELETGNDNIGTA